MVLQHFRRNNAFLFLRNLVLIYIIIYVGFAVGYSVFGPRQFSYRNSTVTQQVASIFTQPIMEIAANGSVNRWYNWNTINRPTSELKNTRFTSISSNNSTGVDYTKDVDFSNFLSVFSSKTEAVVLQPRQYSGNWSIIFCTNQICKESHLYVRNEVKMLIDGTFDIMGRAEDGRLIEIDILERIPRTERTDLDLI